ncbi:MAG: bifunctional diaminohydroxyphosphoribosylaminopyrimidine deaminase/5-amino-6-(5-phosphoribosylamino)uracil reductase RibD [Bacteroidota bacterium]
MTWLQEEYDFMRRCFELATRGIGYVAPNPMVGCVIVNNNQIIAEGYHENFGGHHAEVNALQYFNQLQDIERQGAVMYVSLEPCNHYGKTPPCSEAIIKSGISKVVVSNLDPNPLVAGTGLAKLKSAGLTVRHGFLEDEGAFLNRRFFVYHQKKRPYIILKWATSSDGFMAPLANERKNEKQPFWISSEPSRKLVQKWRSEEQAILVGKNTVMEDNPRLTSRHPGSKNPIRIIIDPTLSLGTELNVFQEQGRVLVLNNKQDSKVNQLEYLRFKKNDLSDLLHVLYKSGIQSVIVEGGKFTLDRFIESGLWDESRVFTASHDLNSGLKAPTLIAKPFITERIDKDVLDIFYNKTW